jgi:hypothetical protein
VRRAALRAEHAGVWSWGAGKTAAGVTAAAVRPVPAAVKDGLEQRSGPAPAKAGNRPAPVALDLPWWHPGTAQEQPEEQAAGTAQEQGAEQGQEQGGEQVQGGPQEQAAIEIGKSYSHCSRCLGNVTDYATAEACDGCGARFVELRPDYAEHVEQIKSERSDLPVVGPQSRSPHPSGLSPEQPAAMTVVGEKQSHCSRCLSPVSPDWTECRTCQAALTGFMTTSGAYLPRDPENRGSGADGWPMVAEVREIPDCDVHSQVLGTPGVPAAYDAEMKSGAWAFMCPDCFEQHGTGELGLGKGQRLALKAPTTDPAESLNSAPAPADGPTDGAPAPDTTTPTTEGDPMFNRSANVPTVELHGRGTRPRHHHTHPQRPRLRSSGSPSTSRRCRRTRSSCRSSSSARSSGRTSAAGASAGTWTLPAPPTRNPPQPSPPLSRSSRTSRRSTPGSPRTSPAADLPDPGGLGRLPCGPAPYPSLTRRGGTDARLHARPSGADPCPPASTAPEEVPQAAVP